MISQLSLRDRSDAQFFLTHPTSTPNRGLTRIEGLIGAAAPRTVLRPRPQQHGGVNDTLYVQEGLVVIEGEVVGATQTAALSELDSILNVLNYSRTKIGGAQVANLMEWTRADGLALQARVQLTSAVSVPIADSLTLLPYQAQFTAEDPRAYGTARTATYTMDGSTATLTQSGIADTPYTMTVYGPFSAVDVLLTHSPSGTTWHFVTSGVTLTNTDRLTIDSYARTVQQSSTGLSALRYVDFTQTTWKDIPPGGTLSISATFTDGISGASKVQVDCTDAYPLGG